MVVAQAFRSGLFDRPAGDAMTVDVQEEWKRNSARDKVEELWNCELNWEFESVAELSRLIADDTVIAVVDPDLIARLNARERVRHTELIRGSVSLRKAVADKIRLSKLDAFPNESLYVWPADQYDETLLGAMKYLLALNDISDQKFAMT